MRSINVIRSFIIACLIACVVGTPVMAYWYEVGPAPVAKAKGSTDQQTWVSTLCVTQGTTVYFEDDDSFDNDIANDPSYAADTIDSWSWDFGDGEYDSGAQVSHAFNTVGDYLVKLTVDDEPVLADDDPVESDEENSVRVYVLPSSITVTDDGDYTPSTTQLHAIWTDCGDLTYEYAIGTTSGGTDVLGWTACEEPEVTATGLTLENEETYYFSVKAKGDMTGCTSNAGVSDGITVDSSNPTVAITSPSGTVWPKTSSEIVISGTATDAETDVASVQVKINSGNWESADYNSGTDAWSYDWENPPIGTARIYAKATDLAGNSSEVYKDITVTSSTVIYVNTNRPDDSGNALSWAAAKKTVGAALSIADSDDSVWVAAGVYEENLVLPVGVALYGGFLGDEDELSERCWTVNETVLDGDEYATVVKLYASGAGSSLIDGFTIRDGYGYDQDGNAGGVFCANTSGAALKVSHCVIQDNDGDLAGGIGVESGTVTVDNCLIVSNSGDSAGGVGREGGSLTLTNNTIVDNVGAGVWTYTSGLTLANNLIAYNDIGVDSYSGTHSLTANNVYGNDTNYNGLSAGGTDISQDPLFVYRAGGDYHVRAPSPCIDGGNSASAVWPTDGEGFSREIEGNANGVVKVDIGCYEYGGATPTFQCIGLAWNPSDGGSGVACEVQYRKASESTWYDGLDLWYDDKHGSLFPGYRGSIVNLDPNTEYVIRLSLDGTSTATTVSAKTWNDEFPEGTVVPVYNSSSTLTINSSGTPAGYRVYEPAQGEGTITLNHVNYDCVDVYGSYVIIRGLTLQGSGRHCIVLRPGVHDVVIEDCDMSDWGERVGRPQGWEGYWEDDWGEDMNAGVYAFSENNHRIIVQRNKIHDPYSDTNSWDEWREDLGTYHPAGPQAVALLRTAGNNVIRYNEVYSGSGGYFNDCLGGLDNASYAGFPGNDSDIYGNYLANCCDDGIEAEGGDRNVRIWGNFITYTLDKIATATTSIGPLYIWRNVASYSRKNESELGWVFLKAQSDRTIGNVTYGNGRIYLFHNTILQPPGSPDTQGCNAGYGIANEGFTLGNLVSRNNILIARKEWWDSIGDSTANLSSSYDYDLYNGHLHCYGSGYSDGPPEVPGEEPAGHGFRGYPTYDGTPSYTLTNDNGTLIGSFVLSTQSSGYDDGVVLPNFNDDACNSPDMGAHERACEGTTPPMEFGVNAYE